MGRQVKAICLQCGRLFTVDKDDLPYAHCDECTGEVVSEKAYLEEKMYLDEQI